MLFHLLNSTLSDLPLRIYGSSAESVGENGTLQGQAGESVTRGDRWRRELEARTAVATARLPGLGVWWVIDSRLWKRGILCYQRVLAGSAAILTHRFC